jgi:hypothetical protein
VQVGNAFVNQYYNVLHQSPQVVHRFYTDASLFTRAEAGPDGAVDTVMTQDVCLLEPSTRLILYQRGFQLPLPMVSCDSCF